MTGAQNGDVVTITVNEMEFSGSVMAGEFSIDVPGSELAMDSTASVSVTTSDLAGNTATGSQNISYEVDTEAPSAPTILVANASQVSGLAEPGSTVNLDIGGTLYEVIADSDDGTFSVSPEAPDVFAVDEEITATATDAAGNISDEGDSIIGDGIVSGTSGDDVIDENFTGDPHGELVDGPDGDDDIIAAGAGDDVVVAGAGNDNIAGGEGDDTLTGGAGRDTLDGGDGADTFKLTAVSETSVTLSLIHI